MLDHYILVQTLTGQLPSTDQPRRINDVASELGWRPSDRLDVPASREFTTAHLIVEHGLEHTAVISFLRHPNRFGELNSFQQKVLVGSSYNNLIDWHINVDFDGVTFVYNRYRPPDFWVSREQLSRKDASALSSAVFRKIAAAHPSPDVPALDRAIIQTISLWKRQIGGELPGISTLSALFNALIFTRAAEDHSRNQGRTPGESQVLGELMSSDHAAQHLGPVHLRTIIAAGLDKLEIKNVPQGLIDFEALAAFDELDQALVAELISDFYRNRFARYYEYDFSFMSKHALSRIYEHYVSLLRIPDTNQISLLPPLADESTDRSFGNVYTPEFIARFFARYLRANLPLRTFQRLRVVDPACGSGIFLRAVLELQNEVLLNSRTTESIRTAFDNITGIDVDPNACHAALLSLSLLSLVLLDELPQQLKILTLDALTYYLGHPETNGTADVVVANPPYVKVETQDVETRARIDQVLDGAAAGRSDLYLAILKIALDLLGPGGYGLFVLPETFLKSESAAGVRRLVTEQAWIKAVVDLTAVRVFEDVGVYTVLLIFQKKTGAAETPPPAKIVRCQDQVGQALEDMLDERLVESSFYTIHETSQDAFAPDEWSLVTPSVALILRRYADLAELGREYQLHQGMNTGADVVFILPMDELPDGEEALFAPLLTDREMESYTVPRSVQSYVFYPFQKGVALDETSLRDGYPKTWSYLENRRERLLSRSAVKRGMLAWWKPERPRNPKLLFRPKIVTPHVVIAPRFGFDMQGRYAISRAPLILSRTVGAAERDHLCYLLAVLNSTACFWHIAHRSHVYERGYSRLEISRLKGTRIPSFSSVDKSVARRLIRLVEARIEATAGAAFDIEKSMDLLIADLYGLDSNQRRLIGVEEG
jgi:methylase of polypeptide subunit release factors